MSPVRSRVVIDGQQTEIDRDVLRRILACADHNLRQCRKVDGARFPQIDRDALTVVTDLRARHDLW